ncbi:MAG TPA: hypothetical protein VJ885_09100 [Thermoanaerobaculia bacterium]|nr:hypothetical protein [Thermoanaerobaculia bacterium]
MSRRSEGSAREGCAGWVGIALLLLASLLLTSTPQEVYRWSHRNGYTRTEIEVLSPPDSHLRWMSVRVLSTGQKLSIKRNSFTGSRDRKRLPAWYNPDARWALGITIFDERLVSAEDNAELPDAGSVFGLLFVTVASALLGVFLLRSPAQDRKSSTKRKRIR